MVITFLIWVCALLNILEIRVQLREGGPTAYEWATFNFLMALTFMLVSFYVAGLTTRWEWL